MIWNFDLLLDVIGMVFIMAIPAILIVTFFKTFFDKPKPSDGNTVELDEDESFLFNKNVIHKNEEDHNTFMDLEYASFCFNMWHKED
jgi:hypothetical protein